MTNNEFLSKVSKIFNNKYTYIINANVYNKEVISVKCPIHGIFNVSVFNHLHHKSECPICRADKSNSPYKSNDELKFKLDKVLNGKFNYKNLNYKNKKIILICDKHGEFECSIRSILKNKKAICPKCNRESKLSYCSNYKQIQEEYKDEYIKWKNIFIRCYNKKYLEKTPSYKNCRICDEWRNFDIFLKWIKDEKNGYRKDYELDKDLIIQGNKEYSPSTCCFIPQFLNSALTRSERGRGSIKSIGVTKRGDKYLSRCNLGHKEAKKIGIYDTEDEAFLAYKKVKKEYLIKIGEKLYLEGSITLRVYQAILRYEIKQY